VAAFAVLEKTRSKTSIGLQNKKCNEKKKKLVCRHAFQFYCLFLPEARAAGNAATEWMRGRFEAAGLALETRDELSARLGNRSRLDDVTAGGWVKTWM
jgi:hypothetical protein